MTVSAEGRDRALVRTLAMAGGLLVGAWVVVGLLLGLVHLLDAIRLRHVFLAPGSPPVAAQLGAFLLVSMLWLAAFGALALGIALGVAALVLDDSRRRAVLFPGVVVLGAAAQVVFVQLDASATGTSPRSMTPLLSAVGAVASPLLVLLAVVVLVGPLLRTPRSTPAPAAAG